MTEEKLMDLSFEGYIKNGGRLNEESFNKAMDVWPKISKGEEIELNERSIGQAEGMADFCKIPITREQKYLYACLREMDIRGAKGGLCDQEVLVEALSFTGDTVGRETFVNRHPHIFK